MDENMNAAAAAPAVTDLSAALPQNTAELPIVFPGTSKPTGWVITMAGPGHARTVAYNDAQERNRLHKESLIEQARANGRKYKAEELAPQESRREFIEGLVARMVTWTPVNFGWGVVTFSEAAAVDVLLRPEVGVYVGQIVDFLLAERAFMKGSAKD